MPRIKGSGDEEIKNLIRQVLRANKKMYLSQIARAINKSPATVYFYLKTFMKDEVEMVESVGKGGAKLVTYYRLKK